MYDFLSYNISKMTKGKQLTGMMICLLAVLFLGQCGKAEGDLKLGGWQEIPLSEQKSYQSAFDFLLQQANEISSGYVIDKVEMQVVAGFNFRFTLQT